LPIQSSLSAAFARVGDECPSTLGTDPEASGANFSLLCSALRLSEFAKSWHKQSGQLRQPEGWSGPSP
jgi:hypothetical protein